MPVRFLETEEVGVVAVPGMILDLPGEANPVQCDNRPGLVLQGLTLGRRESVVETLIRHPIRQVLDFGVGLNLQARHIGMAVNGFPFDQFFVHNVPLGVGLLDLGVDDRLLRRGDPIAERLEFGLGLLQAPPGVLQFGPGGFDSPLGHFTLRPYRLQRGGGICKAGGHLSEAASFSSLVLSARSPHHLVLGIARQVVPLHGYSISVVDASVSV
mmetsp:Transcript_12885/g.37816  ORF Transcript_12885/g.37816 Transcript_12885/m.37816 type:complete len:213 (+) Transcript_12885:1002-1640(+)